ncbi:MAG: histidine kinase [Steroidobacteraceae bacterium]|nr:histidine kinase [Steroidobacteraceae bacterium]MDW8260493.1 histidine kinase [Gammaproteobacteria bacterium]
MSSSSMSGLDRNNGALDQSIVAAIAAATAPSDWFALIDPQQRCVHLQRGELGDIPERLIGVRTGESQTLIGDVLRDGARRETIRVFDDPQLGPRTFAYQFRPLIDQLGVAAVLVSCNETTAARANVQAARLQGLVLEAMRDGVLLLGAAQTVRLCNPAALRLLGLESGTAAGVPLAELSPTLDEVLRRCGEQPQEFEVKLSGAADTVLHCTSRTLHIDGTAHRLVILRDVTLRRQLEHEILASEQRERERIGRELHDGLGQELTGVALLLRSCLPRVSELEASTGARLREALDIVNGVIASAREIANGIFSAAVPDRNLCHALQELAARATARSEVAVRFQFQGEHAPSLSESAANGIFRLAQEATTNALRHSGARTIDITLGADATGILLRIDDDGCGFDPAVRHSGGSGLRIMRFRAHALGGELRIAPRPGGGTRVECLLPATLAR